MWFKVDDINLVGKKIVERDSFHLMISDYKHVWSKSIHDNEVISIVKKFNPLFEAPISKLKKTVLDLFEENKNVKKEITNRHEDLVLKLITSKLDIKFIFEVTLSKSDETKLFNEFTVPLLLNLKIMQSLQSKLIEIIKMKDREIEEYKEERVVSRTGFCGTKKFSETEVENHYECSTLVLKSKELFNCINDKLNCIEEEMKHKIHSESICDCKKPTVSNHVFAKSEDCKKPSVKIENQMVKKRKKQNKYF